MNSELNWFKKLNIPVTIFREGDILFFKSPDEEKGKLFPKTKSQIFGASKEIGDFQVNFFNDKGGEIKHFSVQVRFGIWQFDKL